MQSITLQNVADTDIVNNDILGQICFAAPNEAGGTDSILIAASMFARSEGTFAADNNATELVFVTGATESAAPGATNYDMTLSSAGNLTVVGDLTISGDDLTMATNTSGAALIADGTNFNPVVISGDIAIGTDGTAAIQANSVDGTMIALGSDTTGDIMYYNGTNYVRLAAAQDGYILTATGAGAAPAWEAAAGGGGGATDLDGLTDVISNITNFTDSILISPDGAAPPTGTLSSALGNVGLGKDNLAAITQGDYNVAIGYTAGAAVTTGYTNVFIGEKAGNAVDTGYGNVCLGINSLMRSTSGNANVAIGYQAMKGAEGATHSSYNIAIGQKALYGIGIGDWNIAIGTSAAEAELGSYMLYIAYAKEASDGTLIKGDMYNKFLAIGMADDNFSSSSGSATLQIYSKTSTDKAIYVKQIASQSGDLLLMENSSGTDLFLISSAGVVTTGTWQGTAIATAYIADDAITGAKIALFDDSLAATTTHFLIADGTDYSSFALSGDVTCTNAGVVSIAGGSVDGTMIALGSDETGDIMYHNGTNYVRLPKGDDGEVLTLMSGVPSWESSGGGGMP